MTHRPIQDPEASPLREGFAVIYAPSRKRDRFPENCVTPVDSAAAARERADPARKLYAARVIGPSRSSEGLRLYYLLDWLA